MYFDDSDVATYMNDTLTANGIDFLAQCIPAICAFVDKYCNRTWTTADDTVQITETFDGGTDTFIISTPPINSIVSVTINGNLQDSNFYYNYKTYIQLFDAAEIGNQNVVIVYTTNANTCPVDLKQALIMWAARMLDESDDDGKQTTRVQSGPIASYFKQEGDIPDFVLRVLDSYRLTPGF